MEWRMSILDILGAVAAESSRDDLHGAMPPDIVRFTLEYPTPPDLGKARQSLAEFLGSDRFVLEPLDPELAHFLVLQFPGVPRTISTPTLYAMADEFVRRLNLVSCVPDTGTTFIVEPGPETEPESVITDPILNITCWAKENDQLPPLWAVTNIAADRAWMMTEGTGILIAQPDTGVAAHPELNDVLDLAKATNVLDGTNDPTDPLLERMGNPGHGTATASVVASRRPGQVTGSAPAAKVAPIRCVNSVVLGIDGSPVARAVAHATKIGADVITMSLGGPLYHPGLGAAIANAVKADIIVLAAAGNCVQPIVVYPASDPNVIALAGVDIENRPWKGTSRGPKIDICAPAENVFVARRQPNDGGVGTVRPSQGTSFASAITAGVAALWLAHHGRNAVRQEARRRHTSVHQLFRSAVRQTARPVNVAPNRRSNFGAGVVNAEDLLRLSLGDIRLAPIAQTPAAADPETAVNAVMAEAALRTNVRFDWRRHGAEAVFLATDAWRRAAPERAMLTESVRKPEPTPDLAATMPAVLRTAIAQSDAAPAIRPPAVRDPIEVVNRVRILGAPGVTGPESSAAISFESARQNLSNGGAVDLERAAIDAFDRLNAQDPRPEALAARQRVVDQAKEVARALAEGGRLPSQLDQTVALEALVKLKGRPALRVVDGTVDPTDPLFGEWGGTFVAVPGLPQLTRAVGRIDAQGEHIGTGFLIGPGLVMTNRHVLEAIAEEIRGTEAARWMFPHDPPSIDFSETADGSRRFRITGVLAAGTDRTFGLINFSHLDMALISVEQTNGAGRPLPGPLGVIAEGTRTTTKTELFVIGYPARPGTSAMKDPVTGQFSAEVAKRLGEIFNVQYGRKYLSPGLMEKTVGTVPGDSKSWIFSHDATTLGGNSGSCVIALEYPLGVIGLHFGGATLTANYAHALPQVKDANALGPLSGGGVRWL
jgi:serine protease